MHSVRVCVCLRTCCSGVGGWSAKVRDKNVLSRGHVETAAVEQSRFSNDCNCKLSLLESIFPGHSHSAALMS